MLQLNARTEFLACFSGFFLGAFSLVTATFDGRAMLSIFMGTAYIIASTRTLGRLLRAPELVLQAGRIDR